MAVDYDDLTHKLDWLGDQHDPDSLADGGERWTWKDGGSGRVLTSETGDIGGVVTAIPDPDDADHVFHITSLNVSASVPYEQYASRLVREMEDVATALGLRVVTMDAIDDAQIALLESLGYEEVGTFGLFATPRFAKQVVPFERRRR